MPNYSIVIPPSDSLSITVEGEIARRVARWTYAIRQSAQDDLSDGPDWKVEAHEYMDVLGRLRLEQAVDGTRRARQ